MEAFLKFKDAINAFLPTWRVIEVRAIADLDTGTLASMAACLSPDDVRPLEVTPPVQGIVFIRETVPISELNRILDGWENGSISLGSHQLSTSAFSSTNFRDLSSAWDDLVLGWPEFRMYRQFLLYSYGSKNLEALLQKRDTWAIGRILGFNSFQELALHRVQFQVGGAYHTRMEIFAPVFASIEPKAETTRIQLKIRIHQALQTDDLSLSHRVQDRSGNRLAGGPIPITEFQKTTQGYFTVLESAVDIPPRTVSGEFHLFHKQHRSQKEPIATTLFSVPPMPGAANPRWDLVVSIVANTRKWTKAGIEPEETLKQWLGLAQPRPEQKEFELGVATLIFAAGLPILAIGEAEGVDQIVLTEPTKAAVAASCTTSPDIGGKIANLAMQRNRIRDKLPGFSVRAAIFAPVDERDLRLGDIEDCQDQDINLVLRQELKALFDQVRGVNWSQAADSLIQILTRPTSMGSHYTEYPRIRRDSI